MVNLTERQAMLLAFCWGFYCENDQLPTHMAVVSKFGWSSPNAARDMLAVLVRKGLLKRNVLGKLKFTEAGRAYITATMELA